VSLKPITDSRLAEVQAALSTRFEQQTRPPEVMNRRAALALGGAYLEYPAGSGRLYFLRPVPYPRGLRLQALMTQINTLQARRRRGGTENLAKLGWRYRQAVREFKSLVRPASRLRRLFWWLTPNPFRNCGELEVSQLMVFFCTWTMKSTVQFYSPLEVAEADGQ
jgi:hypothetical protein